MEIIINKIYLLMGKARGNKSIEGRIFHCEVKCDFWVSELQFRRHWKDEVTHHLILYWRKSESYNNLFHVLSDRLVIIRGDPELSGEIQCKKNFNLSEANTGLSVWHAYMAVK